MNLFDLFKQLLYRIFLKKIHSLTVCSLIEKYKHFSTLYLFGLISFFWMMVNNLAWMCTAMVSLVTLSFTIDDDDDDDDDDMLGLSLTPWLGLSNVQKRG
jgi:hypothetical protein